MESLKITIRHGITVLEFKVPISTRSRGNYAWWEMAGETNNIRGLISGSVDKFIELLKNRPKRAPLN